MSAAAATAARPGPATGARVLRFVREHVLTLYAALALAYLFLPIAVVVLFSFNNPAGRFNYTWQGFTFKNWTDPFGYPAIKGAMETSLEIAALSAIVATVLGTLIALALVRYAFTGRGFVNLLIFTPMTTPEIVMGASLLTLFLNQNIATGFLTIFIAHVMFNISYVVVTVRARLAGFDRHLEEAAMDLGANEWTTFAKVTLPLIAPGIMAASLLAFALSIDDFVITYFNAGATITFPLFVWGAARQAVPPQINVIGSLVFFVAVGLMLANISVQRRRARKEGLA
ncbi:MAG: spermidine/putrescine transport system permease protein [Gaiellaceae bacterium]|jgi:spermidine/putrescine transport system permease protein|nr:spermidine/putrescine transport system permease protein [Gaiellaceae bacterium]